MLAAVGYINPEITGKLPSYLSPSMGIKFADIPVGFTSDGNVKDPKPRRKTELKHGRVARLATMGYITPEITGRRMGAWP